MAKTICYCTLVSLSIFLALGLASFIARIFLAVILVSILYSMVATKSYFSEKPVKYMFLLLLFITIYFLLTWGFVGNNPQYGNIVGFYSNIGLALGIFFFGLYCSVNADISEDALKVFFIIFLASLLFRLVTSKASIQDQTYGTLTLNMGYDFVALLPYIFLFKKKWIPILVSPIIFISVLACIKRGAIIITSLFYVYYIYEYFIKAEKFHKVRNLILSVLLLFFIAYCGWDYYLQDDQLQRRMTSLMEGDSNGRNVIFSAIFDNWLNSDYIQIIFGNGFCASFKIAGNYAHNDWLELLAMSGILGPLLYLSFFISEYKYAKSISNLNERLCIIIILIIWFSKTLFSMSYCSVSTMPLSLLLGYMIGRNISIYNSCDYEIE